MKNVFTVFVSIAIIIISFIFLDGIPMHATKVKNVESAESKGNVGEIVYIHNYEEFSKLFNGNSFIVFGKSGCDYCHRYLNVLSRVIESNKVTIYYIDIASLSSDDYEKIVNIKLVIPAECSKTGNASTLSDGFYTPLSLFLENGNTKDCISGFVNETKVLNKLKLA